MSTSARILTVLIYMYIVVGVLMVAAKNNQSLLWKWPKMLKEYLNMNIL